MQNESLDRCGEVYFALCKAVDTPISLGRWLRFKYGEHLQLAEDAIRPEWYCSASRFQRDYLVSEFLSKYKGLRTGVDVEARALHSFATNEEVCQQTNHRLRDIRLRGCSPRVEAVLFTAKRKIASILPDYDKSWWLPLCKWGPGATFSLKGQEAHLDNKIREDQMSVTAAALPYLREVISDDYAWLRSRGVEADGPVNLVKGFEVVRGCRVTTVPKSAKTDRTIAIEPTGNSFLQGGIGMFLRGCLLRTGIDLNDQSRNQNAAKEALKRRLATVDLKAASDTVSVELVYELLPLDWAMALDDLRSKYYRMPDGTWKRFEKFSTMGNGFTFELETLIFWAISSAVLEIEGVKEQVLVYGDDIILPSRCVPLLLDAFTVCGFTINLEKTHFDSAFRESCGKHYFNGVDVSPVYQKEVPDVLEEVYRLANRLRRLAFRLGFGTWCDGILRNAWLAAIRGIRIRHATPIDSEDDDGLALPSDEIKSYNLDRGSDPYGVILPVLTFKSSRISFTDSSGLLAYWLRFTPSCLLDNKKRLAVRRRGKYVSRRRKYRVGCRTAPWLDL